MSAIKCARTSYLAPSNYGAWPSNVDQLLSAKKEDRSIFFFFSQNSTMHTTVQHAIQVLISSPPSEKRDPLPRESNPGLASSSNPASQGVVF